MDKIKQFFKDVWMEVNKVTYPKWEELKGSTAVVIVSVFIVSIYLGIVDKVLSSVVEWLLRS